MAPRHASAWNGYGFLNYRACQAYGSEIIYGAYYAAGEQRSLVVLLLFFCAVVVLFRLLDHGNTTVTVTVTVHP